MTSPSYVITKTPPVPGCSDTSPRSVPNVERSSCAIHAARNSQWHCVQYRIAILGPDALLIQEPPAVARSTSKPTLALILHRVLADGAALIPRPCRMRSALGTATTAAFHLFGVAKRERARIAASPPARERPRSSTRLPRAESCGRTDSKAATSSADLRIPDDEFCLVPEFSCDPRAFRRFHSCALSDYADKSHGAGR